MDKQRKIAINRLARAFGYSRSSYYHLKNFEPKINERKLSIMEKIMDIYNKSHGIYGCQRITMALHGEGISCDKKTVRLYMRELNIHSIVMKKFKYKKTNFNDYRYIALKNYVKENEPTGINQVWTQDITYIKLSDGSNAYLASVIDMYSKKVISYELSRSMTVELIIRVLKHAYETRKPGEGLILHSDKGAQYTCDKYKLFAMEKKAICSYTRIVYSCADNAGQESFHATLKKECIYQIKTQTFENAKKIISSFIDDFYNSSRIHSSIGYVTPEQFEEKIKQEEKNTEKKPTSKLLGISIMPKK